MYLNHVMLELIKAIDVSFIPIPSLTYLGLNKASSCDNRLGNASEIPVDKMMSRMNIPDPNQVS